MDKISIVVPCYNEEAALPFFYQSFKKLSDHMHSTAKLELILVNDGSSDKTNAVLHELANQDDRIKYISFTRNFGKEAAMLAGLEHSTGDYVTIADADLQDPLEMIIQMYEIINKEDYDCVATRRYSRQGEPPIRSFFANKFYTVINLFSKTKIVNGARDFRLMSRHMVNSILQMKEYNRFSKGLFSFVGYNTKWLEYKNVERVAGESSWSFWSLFRYSMDGILSFSTAPLHIAAILGAVICFFSFLFICYTLFKTLVWGDPVSGYPTLVCIITFLGGVQLLCVGILSEYISKIYSEVKKRPIYIVKETNSKTNFKED